MRDRLRIGWSSLACFAAVLGLALLPVTGAFAAQPAKAPDAGKQALIPAEDVDASLPTLYPRANYQWPYATGPHVGNVDPANPPASGVLYTVAGAIDTTRGVPAIPMELRATFKLGKQQAQYFLLQVEPSMYADGSFARLEESIESAGGAVSQSLGPDGFIVRLTAAGHAAIRGQGGVRFLEPYHPAFKLDPDIGRSPLTDPAKALSSVYSLQVRLFPGEDAGAVARALQAMGGTILAVSPAQVEVEIDRGRLGDIASLDPVYAVYEEGIYIPLDEKATTTVQTGHWNLGAVPYHDAGIDGSGNGVAGTSPQIFSITDTGIQLDAGDLSNTKTDAGTAGPTHRKVVDYRATTGFGTGSGDLLGCDAPMTGGFTHGQIVASVALGNASRTPTSYGGSWYAVDQNTRRPWAIDGVAKGAKIGVFDCQVSTTVTACDGPTATTLKPGLAYTPASVCDATAGFAQGTLCYGYGQYGARVFNWSWGSTATADLSKYTAYPQQADQFLFEYPDAMLFVAAGNSGRDSDRDFVPDPYRSYAPATVKNGIVVGNHYTANDGGSDFTKARVSASGTGPASTASQRITPLIMAPGQDIGSLGVPSTYACRSNDNDQLNPVQCDFPSNQGNSSFAAAAAAGAGLLIRDYFAQGFYPSGAQVDANRVPDLSGALLKTVLMLSGDFLDGTSLFVSPTLNAKYRFNYEQGYGRIQLNNALPLATYSSPPSMIVADGGIPGGKNDTTLAGSIGQGAVQSFAFTVNDTSHELRVGLSWVEAQGDVMANDLDLELVSPSGRTYAGNYFTDDLNRNRLVDAGEDCQLAPWCTAGLVDASRWSLPYDSAHQTLANIWDRKNPTEAIFLSPSFNPSDPSYNQLEAGTWTVSVTGFNVPVGSQKYALAIVGPVSRGSWAGIEVHHTVGGADTVVVGDIACDDKVKVVIDEFEDVADPTAGHTPALISSRVRVEVVDSGVDRIYGTADDVVVDTETGLTFTNTVGHVFTSGLIAISAGTVPDPGNGALDVRDGQYVRVVYEDIGATRTAVKPVSCHVQFEFGGVKFTLYGQDASVAVNGGCERDARGYFTSIYGYPDQYMDHGELIDFQIAIRQFDSADLEDAAATLKAVLHDTDSPQGCRPFSRDCADPNRTNNAVVDPSILHVLDSPRSIGFVPALIPWGFGRYTSPAFGISFTIQMGSFDGLYDVDLLLGISAKKSGKAAEGLAVYRTWLNANEQAVYYSTDFPTGGTEYYDWNNNETIESPATFLGDVNNACDYRFESVTWSDLTQGGTRNTGIQAPWNFDTNNGGFTAGIVVNSTTTLTPLPANWGEDRNFNNVLDAGEDRDPANGVLDQNWSTLGGCGWETRASGQLTGGVWHTGTIGSVSAVACMVDGSTLGQCQRTEPFPAAAGSGRFWWENLETPIVSKVNLDQDADGRYVYTTQFTNWAWNMEIDLPDSWTRLSWELDTDTDALRPITLNGDNQRFNSMLGPFGALHGGNWPLFNGYPQFADYSGTITWNGTAGGNREARNCCAFEQAGNAGRSNPPIFPHPLDDDLRNGWCNDPSNPSDKQTSCTASTAAAVCQPPNYDGTCSFDPTTTTDQFVKLNGPLRNMNMMAVNGFIDGRFKVFEETYGPDGINWQGAVGYMVNEAFGGLPQVRGYGVAIDDMVLEWKESRVVEDTTTSCATGSCATLDVATTQSYNSLGRLDITVTDTAPGNPAGGNNDCDHNGVYTDAGIDSTDCDGDGRRDVYVQVTSLADPAGEWVVLNETTQGSRVFRANLPVSSAYESPGTLYVRPEGSVQPKVTLTYADPDDGTGHPCQPGPNASTWGFVQAAVTINVSTGRVVVKSSRITNDAGMGDGDGFADTNETVNMYVTVSNKTGMDLTNLVARLASNSPNVDCILQPSIVLPSLPAGAILEIPTPFVWKVAPTVSRQAGQELSDLTATFSVTLSSDQFDSTDRVESITQDLDLDVGGGGAPTTFIEGFEGTGGAGDFGTFTSMSLDSQYTAVDPAHSTLLADGTRCQYNDPDFPNSNSYGETYCYPGFSYGVVAPYVWHVHRTSNADGGRAFAGNQSVHWGVHKVAIDPDKDTEALSALQALTLRNPVYLGYGANPELSFKHQISLLDYRALGLSYGHAADRAVVEVQLADPVSGAPQGVWQKIRPYANLYDAQAESQYINCIFDPTDDGNDEDSYFDPTDPNRFYGPSSTCAPELVFAAQGDTNWRNPWIAGNTTRASDDSIGLQGSINRGNWVETRFNLERYKGRAVRLRLLVSTIKVGDAPDAIAALGASFAPRPTDDGWYIDDVEISNALTSPAAVAADTAPNAGLPACPSTCGSVTASLVAGPPATAGPGQQVVLDAAGSVADRCLGGTLQFRFSAGGVTVQDWSDLGSFVDAPAAATTYVVEVRCSTLQSCAGSASTTVAVSCPSTGTLTWTGPLLVGKTGGLDGVEPDQGLTLSWGADGWTDAVRGDLGALRTGGTLTGSVLACSVDDVLGSSATDGSILAPGQAFYYLARGATCNVAPFSYSSGAPEERGSGQTPTIRDLQIGTDPSACR